MIDPMKNESYELGYDVRSRRNAAEMLGVLPPKVALGDAWYSVDDVIWPSLWSREWRDVPRPDFVGPAQHLWMDLDHLRGEASKHTITWPVRWITVEVLMPEHDAMRETWQSRAASVQRPTSAEYQRSFLGYDVADFYLRSWLRPLGSDGDLWRQLSLPIGLLDHRGLFPRDYLSEVLTFVERLNAADVVDSGWCAFAIWELQENKR